MEVENIYTAEISSSVASILDDIADSCKKVGRDPSSVTLLAASKKQSSEKMMAFINTMEQKDLVPIFGENYVQEFKSKRPVLRGIFQAHLIGHLQSNKSRDAVKYFDVIQSLDSLDLATVLDKEAARLGKKQVVYAQVNISDGMNKSGFTVDEIKRDLGDILSLSNIDFRGFMTITMLYEDPEQARPDFRVLRNIRDELAGQYGLQGLELSMGMSDDFPIAIEEGATVVRIGTRLFGARI